MQVGTHDLSKANMLRNTILIAILFCVGVQAQPTPHPLLTSDLEAQNQWVDSIYNSLSIDQKIGQLFMVMAFSENGPDHYAAIEAQVSQSHVGGIIFSLGGPKQQALWTNKLQAKAKTPLLIGMDAEWGIAMRLDSVRPFPWNMTLGAVQNNALIEAVGKRIGEQAARLGVHINFAPDVDLNTNPQNPIIGNRSFGEDKENVSKKAIAFMRGMHAAGVLSSAKHFPGHGDTAKDSHYDLPVINFSEQRLRNTELYPFDRTVEAGVSSVMVGHLNVPSLDPGVPASISKKIIYDELIDRLNYQGLIVTDALNMGAATELKGVQSVSVAAFLAGNDILLIPANLDKAIRKMKRAYNRGIVTEERLTHSVKKILRAKYKVGLSQVSPIDLNQLDADLNTPLDQVLIAQTMAMALTTLKKDKGPFLPADTSIGFVALGDDDGTVFREGLKKEIPLHEVHFTDKVTPTLDALKDVSTVVIGFHRSNASPWKASDFTDVERHLIEKLHQNHRVVLVSFVKPYALSKLSVLDNLPVVVQAYQNNSEAQEAAANLLLGNSESLGKLPVSISSELGVGKGVEIKKQGALQSGLPIEVGMDAAKLKKIDTLAQVVLDSLMAPGFQILAARKGKVFYHKAFGYHTFAKERPVSLTDVYDLASLTKILATLPLAMQAVDQGVFSLEDSLGKLSVQFRSSNKENLELRKVLSHQSGLVPWIPFYQTTLKGKNNKLNRKYYRSKKTKRFSVPVARGIFAHQNLPSMQFQALLNSKLNEEGMKYSDLPFIFLQRILEDTYNQSLEQLSREKVFIPLGLRSTTFRPLNKLSASKIVPSEEDQYFRKQRLQGDVHDMTAAVQGGVSGHAGLFSNAKEVAILMQMYLQGGQYGDTTFFSKDTFELFNTCNYCSQGNRKGVGLDKPQAEGGGMTFKGISLESFGHSGFTGTYAWADPETEIVFIFLSNRTYPQMENRLLIDHSIRPRMLKLVHDAILF